MKVQLYEETCERVQQGIPAAAEVVSGYEMSVWEGMRNVRRDYCTRGFACRIDPRALDQPNRCCDISCDVLHCAKGVEFVSGVPNRKFLDGVDPVAVRDEYNRMSMDAFGHGNEATARPVRDRF